MSLRPAFLRRGSVDFSSPPGLRTEGVAVTAGSASSDGAAAMEPGDDVLDDLPISDACAGDGEITVHAGDADGVAVPPVYGGGARLVNWANTARSGMTVELALRDVGPREVNPFKGLRFGKSNGQRFRTWIGPYSEALEIAGLAEVESVYSGETQLDYYGDTCTKGVTVKVMLDSGPDGVRGKHPFEGMPIGNIEGADLFVGFWAIDDDESIIPKKAARKSTPFYRLSEVRQSNLVVNDEEFVNFLAARLDRLVTNPPDIALEDNPKAWAEQVVRSYLGVASRGIMNDETLEGVEARKRWKVLMAEYHQSDEFNTRRRYFGR